MFDWLFRWFKRGKKEYVYFFNYYDFAKTQNLVSTQFSAQPLNIKKYPNMYGGHFTNIRLLLVYEYDFSEHEE